MHGPLQNAGGVETMPDDLQSDRQAIVVIAGTYEAAGCSDMFKGARERECSTDGPGTARCRLVDRVRCDGRGRADQEVISLDGCQAFSRISMIVRGAQSITTHYGPSRAGTTREEKA